MAIINASGGGVKPKVLTTPDGVTDEIAIEKASSGKVKPSSTLGNATADKVLVGNTFTSDSGFAMTGTLAIEADLEDIKVAIEENIDYLSNNSSMTISRVNAGSSSSAVDKNILTVSGAGELHFLYIYTGYTNVSNNQYYARVTFDNDFVMYVPAGYNPTSSSYDEGGDGIFTVFDYITFIDGYSTGTNQYDLKVSVGGGDYTVHALEGDRNMPFSTSAITGSRQYVIQDPSLNSVLENAYKLCGSPRPLRFESSLKIDYVGPQAAAGTYVAYGYALT